MRKHLLSLLLISLISLASFAAKEDSYLLHQGFEDGAIPASWTQEYVVGQTAWTVEANASMTYPTGAFEGGYSATLRNTTAQTQHFVTRLISPVMDLSAAFQPILVFSHAQPQRTGDVDTLRVYYRTSAEGRWVKLAEYDKKITTWQTDTIELTGASSSYQICFEGTDNFGRGISLDEIIVRPMPTCDDPTHVTIDGLTANSATLRWNGSLDTDSFHIVLSTAKISDVATADPSKIVWEGYVADFTYSFESLQRNTTYYVYLQANCAAEQSEWIEAKFTTKNLVDLPYSENFDLNYAANTLSHISFWSYGTSIKKEDGSMEYMPFVNQNSASSAWANYSYSNTTCLVFTGACSVSTAIPAGEYVYAATPEMNVDRIQNACVTFWGTAYTYYGDDYKAGLIVGVMTDPADFSTFVPVDTVYVKGAKEFNRYSVDFSNYTGEGKYIAFASNFLDKDNIFYLDNVNVKEAGALPEVSNLEVSKVRSNSLTVNVNAHGAQQVKIVVAKDTTDAQSGAVFMTPANLPASFILYEKTINASQLPYTVTGLEGGRFVQVYAAATDGTHVGEYALPVKALMPCHWNNADSTIDFEANTTDWSVSQLRNFSNAITATYSYPLAMQYPLEIEPGLSSNSYYYIPRYGSGSLSSYTYGHNSSHGCIVLKSERREFGDGRVWTPQYGGQGIALPEVDTIQNLVLRFYLKCSNSTNTACSHIRVGVVEDPQDFSTFQEIASFDGTADYRSCVASFAGYTGNGHFPVILSAPSSVEVSGGSGSGSGVSYKDYVTSANYIDDISLLSKGGCLPPAAPSVTAQDTVATVSWGDNGMNEWIVRLYQDTTLLLSDTVETNAYTFHHLLPHTRYIYTVVTVCDLSTPEENTFTTDCAPAEAIPYVENFDGYTSYGSKRDADVPACWTFPRYAYTSSYSEGTSTSYYPELYSAAASAHSGNGFIYWYYMNTTVLPTDGLLALPRMNADIHALQLSFWMKPSNANYASDTIYVGVMSDPNDLSTFDTVSAIRVGAAEYKERIVRFENYTGNGQYIALRRPREIANHFIYLDDFRVDSLSSCEKVMDVTAKNMNEQGASFTWTSQTSAQWDVVLASKDTTLGASVAAGGAVLNVYTATQKPFTISDCPSANTQYYVYVRANCGNGNVGDWSQACSFKTTCVPVTAGQFGTEDFSAKDAIDCWTVGVREGETTTNKPSRNTNGYLYMSNTTSTDGAYAIMPMLDIDSITRLQVSFTAHGGTSASYLRELTVGVISNPSDLATFSAVKTLSLPKVSATTAAVGYGFNEAQRFTVRFDSYEGDYNGDFGKQIMFLSESGELANYIYIDNVTIDTIPTCPEPLDVTLVEANSNDLTLTWDSLGGEYEVKLLNGTALAKDTITTADTLTIDGLDILSEYSVYVRHICGAGDSSIWSNVRKYETTCPAVFSLPYSEDFEGYTILTSSPYSQPNCWNAWYGGSTASYSRLYASAKYQGTAGYYLGSTTGNATTAAKEAIAVLPAIDGLKNAQLTFYAKATSATGTRGIAIGITDYADELDSVLAHVVWVDSVTTINSTWSPYVFNLSSYTGQGKHLVLRCFGGNTSATTKSTTALYTYLDNLYIEKLPSCFRPLSLASSSATATSLKLSWAPQGDETAWDVAYIQKGGNVENATVVLADTSSFELSGLAPGTEYDVYVRANCGDGDVSSWSDALSASTLYRVELQDAHWNFDDNAMLVQSPLTTTTSYKLQKDWMTGNAVSSTYSNNPYVNKNTYNTTGNLTRNSHYSRSDSCALRIYSSASAAGAYAIMPEVNANLDTLQLHFFGRSCYATGSKVTEVDSVYYLSYATNTGTTKYPHAIKIGTVTDPYDLSTFELITEYTFEDIANTAANKSAIVDGAHWEEVIVPLYGAKGKYVTFLSDYTTAANYVWIDDVVLEKETGCATPSKLTADVTATSASFAWGSSKSQWNVKVTNDQNTVVASAVVDSLGWEVNGLEPHADYTFSVQAICSAEETSEWAVLSFSTPCASQDTAALATSFATTEVEPYFGNATYQLPGCWDGGQLTMASTKTYTYMPQAIANTATYQYGRTTGTTDRALRFYNYSTTYGDSYVILPETNFSLDSTALHFWMRAAYFYTATYSSSASRNKLYAKNSDYQKNLVIGAIADPSDMSTFTAIDTVTYTQSWTATTGIFTKDDASGNDYWEEVTIPLKKYAGKGRIVFFYPSNGKTSYMFLDDLSVVGADFCSAASGLNVTNLGAHSATLNWMISGKDSVVLEVAKNTLDFDSANVVLSDTLVDAGGHYEMTNLLAGQDYYFRVKHLCSEEEEADWATSQLFVTDYEVRFVENFSAVRTYPADWTRSATKVSDAFNGVTPTEVTETATNWTHSVANSDIYVTTGTGTGTGTLTTYYNYWLITPTIDLTSMTAADSLMLGFNLHLTTNTDHLPFNTPAEDDKFIVAVSTDGGTTYTRDNAIVWGSAADDDRAYSEITGKAKTMFVDMSKYAGQDVKIAFIQNSLTTTGKPSSQNYLHLDNVTLNHYTSTEYDAQICRWNDYEDKNFSIDANDLVVGETTTYMRYDRAAAADRLTTMHLTVSKDTITYLQATVCEGENYELDGFHIVNARSTAVYRQKLEGASTCDSIVELSLNVLPRVYTNIEQTICQGDFYEFNGVRYYTNTIHTDTLSSLTTGCDSIVTLYLTVNAILRGEEEVNLCPGESYTFGKYGAITEAGTYTDTLQNALGCDSVATIVVSLHETAATTVRALICKGDSYNESVWSGLTVAGDYPSQQHTIYGCDSIVTLHLMVADAALSVKDSIALADLPYVLNGEELLPVGTLEGVYVKQVQLSCGTAAVTVVVGNPTALHTVMANSLAVTPNPAGVGEPIRVITDLENADVRVLSATGALVYRSHAATSDITLPGLPVAGVYLVTLTVDDKTLQSTLIVR